jgi:hypothetical protein
MNYSLWKRLPGFETIMGIVQNSSHPSKYQKGQFEQREREISDLSLFLPF